MTAPLTHRPVADAYVTDPRNVPDGVYIDNPNRALIPNGSPGRIRVYRDGRLIAMWAARWDTDQWRDMGGRWVEETDLPDYVIDALAVGRAADPRPRHHVRAEAGS